MVHVTIRQLIKEFDLELISGEDEIERGVSTSDISRPGLEMAGFFTYYPAERIQLLGKTELSFLNSLPSEERVDRMEKLCTVETPCVIVSRGLDVPVELIEASKKSGVPVLKTPLKTTHVSSKITNYLETLLAPMTSVHGVLVDVYGIGVLLTGDSGVGKSETALELVKRGHRLVADDSVEIRQTGDNDLVGNPPELIQHLLEIRGLGIIDVMTLFGAGAIRNYKKISMIIHLEPWDSKKMYDRLGLDEDRVQLVGTTIPKLTVPVRPGRNIAVIIEVAAMNFRLKGMGINAAQEFSDRLDENLRQNKN
ncbi:HPr kinase/phosphorylase [Pullulanibacillus pueri]|uniref:HPr kinase/phosphorylase n=1 Tax=Pullulanibacillus pueri TaxID=1437324 RepID=A0A8J3A3F0_9BACL|nr:HPr(Ser) kinase/phosphatase [Pullulanibacillus pueri]MBM7680221.1 HPr kinase/phosphorylase [Pullulanibacillus pueri]GGH89048.1 HPr kinase/phosphorylase [Pullulanibacillus pueri]